MSRRDQLLVILWVVIVGACCLLIVGGLRIVRGTGHQGERHDLFDHGLRPDDCVALVGGEPWITLFEPRLTHRCVLVAEHQDVQIWNKGRSALTIHWVDGQRLLPPDEHFETGPIGAALVPGPNEFASSPYPAPVIWLLPADASPSAHLRLDGETFGPVTPGMTLGQASEALRLAIEIDPTLLPGPTCLGAVIVGDPYSPVFVVALEGDQATSEIIGIEPDIDERSCR